MNIPTKLFSRIAEARRNKKAAAEKEAKAQSALRFFERLHRLGQLPWDLRDELLNAPDADYILMEYAYFTSPNDAVSPSEV